MEKRLKVLVMLIVLLLSITTISAREPNVDDVNNSDEEKVTLETKSDNKSLGNNDESEYLIEKDKLNSPVFKSQKEKGNMGIVYVSYMIDNPIKELESIVIEGVVGTPYKVEILDLEGYVFKGVNEKEGYSALEGTITGGFQVVEVLYDSKLYSSLNFGLFIRDGILAEDVRPDTVNYVVTRTNSNTNERTVIKEEAVDISGYSLKEPVLYEWEILDCERYDDQDNEYIFEVEAEEIDGYTVETSLNIGYENHLYVGITYTAIVDFIDIQFYKEFGPELEILTRDLFKDSRQILFPDSVSIHLLRNGQEVEESPIILSEKNGWRYTLEHYPNVDENGNVYNYEVYEEHIDGFKPEIKVLYIDEHPEFNSRTMAFEVRNHFVKDITVNKQWVNGPQERPAVEFQLYGRWKGQSFGDPDNIEKIGEPIVLDNGKTSYTWNELPYFDFEDIYSPKEINYFVEEVNVPVGYEVSYSEDGLTVINTFTGEGIMEHITGEKIWNDFEDSLGLRPESITLELYANDELLKSIDVSEDDDWRYDFGEYKKYENQELINYVIKEVAVPHYQSEPDGYNVINTIKPSDTPLVKPEEEVSVIDKEEKPLESKPESSETPKTGIYDKNTQKYIVLMIISLCAIGLSYAIKRKHE